MHALFDATRATTRTTSTPKDVSLSFAASFFELRLLLGDARAIRCDTSDNEHNFNAQGRFLIFCCFFLRTEASLRRRARDSMRHERQRAQLQRPRTFPYLLLLLSSN